MVARIEHILALVDSINEWTGRVTSFLIIPLLVIVVTEVTLRYVFNRPTIWAWDVNRQLAGALIMLGLGHVLLHEEHIRIDVVVSHLSPRARVVVDLVLAPLLFFGIGVLVWQLVAEAWESLVVREIWTTLLSPPIYPLKIILAIGAILLLAQVTAKFIRNLIIITSPGASSHRNRASS